MLADKDFSNLEQELGLVFIDRSLLQRVFIHRSALNELKAHGLENNERLEFLGDAVLELAVTEFLYRHYPNSEGELTNWRSALVRGQHLAERAHALKFGDYMYLSRGESKSGGKAKQIILANTFEAMIGAIYLDQGIEAATKFVQNHILIHLDNILKTGKHVDPKSHLQEITQERYGVTPSYVVLTEEGPDHDKKFTIAVSLENKQIGVGTGTSKQTAQVAAAEMALKQLDK